MAIQRVNEKNVPKNDRRLHSGSSGLFERSIMVFESKFVGSLIPDNPHW